MARLERVRARLQALNLDAALLTKPRTMYYLTGFNTVIYSRPQYVIALPDGDPIFIIPSVREKRARRTARVQNILTYDEFAEVPEQRDPVRLLTATLRQLAVGPGRLGIESSSLPVSLYRALCDNLDGWEMADVTQLFQELRMIKDEGEVANVVKAAALAEIGMATAVEAIQSGATEIEANLAAEHAMQVGWSTRFPQDEIVGFGDDEDGVLNTLWCATKAGPRFGVSMPASTHEAIPEGEAVVVIIWTTVNGYGAEIERTVFKGRPRAERRGPYDLLMRAREAALAALRPGTTCEALVDVVNKVMSEQGLRHGPGVVGHGLGLGHHEPPFFKPGERTRIEPGMVLAVEPGLLFPDYGIRHSDTVRVTDSGAVALTPWDRFTELAG